MARKLSSALEFHKQHGHCLVSRPHGRSDKDREKLANWIASQRRQFVDGELSNDRKQLLDDLGFV